MLEINSFLLHPDAKTKQWDEIRSQPSIYFININDERIKDILKFVDPLYIEGSIELKYYGQEVMGIKYWDLIDQLWSYFVNMLEEYKMSGRAETYFPDMPVKIELIKLQHGMIKFVISDSSFVLPEQEFFSEILNSATFFFEKMQDLFIDLDYTHDLERVLKLKGTLNY